tara:strand:+ start:1309 stop:2346 length:1038 start_codon:yes stop_codon:yes gene_type:complete
MKKTFLFFSAILIFACTDDEGNPCVYEPTLTTQAATDITETSATLNGIISIVSENCEVPNNTEQGFVYSTEIQPTLEDIQVNVNGTNITTTIEDLEPNTTYYVRAFLTNNFGDFYGDEIDFTTIDGLINCDGNPVPTIVYGTQEWTVENACNITYRDGTPIPQVTDETEWASLTTGAWCYFYGSSNRILYNAYAVMGVHDNNPNTPNKEFAPSGWHVPTNQEWLTFENYLISNGYNYDGTTTGNKIAKALASTSLWLDSGAQLEAGDVGYEQVNNNSSGFNAFAVGIWDTYFQTFGNEGLQTNFWSSSVDGISRTYAKMLVYFNKNLVTASVNNENGCSVRLVKD